MEKTNTSAIVRNRTNYQKPAKRKGIFIGLCVAILCAGGGLGAGYAIWHKPSSAQAHVFGSVYGEFQVGVRVSDTNYIQLVTIGNAHVNNKPCQVFSAENGLIWDRYVTNDGKIMVYGTPTLSGTSDINILVNGFSINLKNSILNHVDTGIYMSIYGLYTQGVQIDNTNYIRVFSYGNININSKSCTIVCDVEDNGLTFATSTDSEGKISITGTPTKNGLINLNVTIIDGGNSYYATQSFFISLPTPNPSAETLNLITAGVKTYSTDTQFTTMLNNKFSSHYQPVTWDKASPPCNGWNIGCDLINLANPWQIVALIFCENYFVVKSLAGIDTDFDYSLNISSCSKDQDGNFTLEMSQEWRRHSTGNPLSESETGQLRKWLGNLTYSFQNKKFLGASGGGQTNPDFLYMMPTELVDNESGFSYSWANYRTTTFLFALTPVNLASQILFNDPTNTGDHFPSWMFGRTIPW